MLSRLLARSLNRNFKTLFSSSHSTTLLSSLPSHRLPFPNPQPSLLLLQSLRAFSSSGNGDGDGSWDLFREAEDGASSVFGEEKGILSGIAEESESSSGLDKSEAETAGIWVDEPKEDFFGGIDKEMVSNVGGDGDVWGTAEGQERWSLEDADKLANDVFDIGDEGIEGIEETEEECEEEPLSPEERMELEKLEQELLVLEGKGIEGIAEEECEEDPLSPEEGMELEKLEQYLEGKGIEGIEETEEEYEVVPLPPEERLELEMKEQELLVTLKGPNRAFGDLIAASGVTEDMIESLILLKNVRGIEGLPPLHEIEDKAIAKLNASSSRADIERKKQEEISNARVRKVDEKGRAYGTGRRKCSIARVWIKPGDGNFIVNEKQFDSYFPSLDHRAELLRPLTVTSTLGLWDINCTVKGGGVSGQVGAIRLGISRALQNWEPGLRQYLKPVGFLTRDSRVVERKKYGQAKARKSFQWVKR